VRKIIFALAFGALLLPDYGLTLGLGEIEVSTALNQELKAEIELLSAAPEDVETLIVKLASREEFSRAGIERPYLLSSLRFNAAMRNGVPIIEVTSTKPIREPFLNFLIEIDWPKGHMMREYTILLDPPVFMEQLAPVQQEESRPAAMESARPQASGAAADPYSDSGFRPAMAAPSSTAAFAPAPARDVQTAPSRQVAVTSTEPTYTRSYQPPGGHRIQQGDTLWSLADAMRPDQSVSIEQMMLAMLRSNPEAFINENVNGLKKGYILRIPDRDDIVTLSQADAVDLVREQHALWREYQQTVAGGAPVSAMEPDALGEQGAAFEDSADARLEIVAAGSGTSASGTKDPTQMSASELRAELAIARESLETERLEKEGLQERVTSLEGQVDRMKSLLTLEDADLAEMQQVATPADAEAMPEVDAAEQLMVEEPMGLAVEEAELDEAAALEQVTVDDLTVTEEGFEDVAVEEELSDLFVDEQAELEGQAELAETEQPAATVEETADTAYTPPVFSQPQKQDPLSMLLNNPMLLAAAGGGLLLILLLIALIMKRRKSGAADDDFVASNLDDIDSQLSDSVIIDAAEEEPVAQDLAEAGDASGADEPSAEAAAEPSTADTVVSQPEAADQEPRDDIIAEADVYLAYGIYQQAEELLQNALKDNPDKDAYRVKLAETYFAGKNSDAFVELATDMNQRRNGEDTPAWQKFVDIGRQLVPGHALFAGGADSVLDLDDTAPAADDSEGLETGEAEQQATAPGLDLGLDEQAAADDAGSPLDALSEEGVEFDLSETGAEADADADEAGGVEFDLSETQAFEPDQTTTEFDLDIEASELGIEEDSEASDDKEDKDEFDLDLSGDVNSLTAEDEAEGAELSLDEIADDVLDFDADEAGVSSEAAVEEPAETEMSADSEESVEEATILDFSEAAAEPAAESGSVGASMEDDLDLSDLDDIDEVSTKLDLAKAYLDMGDADGTRSILDEVMNEGNDEQKKEADELLRQLG
jgi:pilus assembly protein FimV